MKYRSRKVYEFDVDGMTAELSMEPSHIMNFLDYAIEREAGLLAIGYLVDDPDVENPLEEGDGMGHIYSSHRHSGQHACMQEALGLDSDWSHDHSLVEKQAGEMLMDMVNAMFRADMVAYLIEAASEGMGRDDVLEHFRHDFTGQLPYHRETWLSLKVRQKASWEELLERAWQEGRAAGTIGDPYAVMLDCYEHGGQVWSLSGHGMQCLFDTARGAGIWVPDQCLRESLDSIKEHDGLDAARHKAVEFAGQALGSYNSWLSGDCYGIAVDTFSIESGSLKRIDEAAVFGYIGRNWAEEAMRSEAQNILDHVLHQAA